jgi:signal transduction histidine kinase/DNA-binding response OmpR family regulator
MSQVAKRPMDHDSLAFLAGGGEMGERIRAFDWSKTPLGPVAGWPQSLKVAVRIMLTSRQPFWIGWGKELTKLYNDPYKAIIDGKHPQALGQPASVVWREIWDKIGPMLSTAMSGDEGTYVEAHLLIMERNGYPEETYYTYSYSPIPDDLGGAGGIICANTDDTQRVIGERQVALLRELASGTAHARTWQEACAQSARVLGTDPRDLPFAMIYVAAPDGRSVSLAGVSGIERGHAAAPETVPLDGPSTWPFAEVLRAHEARLVPDLGVTFGGDLPTGAWHQRPSNAAVLPIPATGDTGRAGVLVVGLNPFRLFDDGYQGFLGLVTGQIAASIANAQAYEEEKKRAEALAELDRAKTAFFSNVSHEFRTPLTLMLGPIEDLLAKSHTDLPPAAAGQLEVVNRNGLRLLRLVNTLLDFSRIEAGRVRAVYEPTDLATYTADLASVFRAAVERAGLKLTVDCPPLREPVYVDREMWEKIVLNLLSNAFKFTFAGEIAVALRQDGNSAELRVRDTGTGIPAAEMPRLFERFHRVQNSRGRTHEGTGIGLALVQELVKLHGGSVAAESVFGKGTTFTVTVPLGKAHLPPDQIGGSRTLASAATGASPFVEEALRWLPDDGETRSDESEELPSRYEPLPVPHPQPGPKDVDDRPRVLVADDNADMRQYVVRLLAERYQVEAVPDGEAALAVARERTPDLILTDVMMPRLDGLELLRALRADARTSGVPVIMLSARAGEESRIEGMEAGADDYLIKPFSARELLARVSAHLQMAQVRRDSERAVGEREAWLAGQNEALRAAVSGESLEVALSVLVRTAIEQMGGDARAGFYVSNPEGTELHQVVGMPDSYARCVDGFKIGPDSLACGLVARTGEPVITRDVAKEPRWKPWLWLAEEYEFRSVWGFPVQTGVGKFVGTLALYFREPRDVTPRDHALAAALTHAAGIIIARHLAAEERDRVNEALRSLNAQLVADVESMKRMQEVSTRMVAAGDFSALLDEILGAALGITGTDMGNIQLLEGEALKIVSQRGFKAPFLDFFDAVHKGYGATCGTAMQRGERVIVEDVTESPVFAGTPALEVVLAADVRAVQSTPLVSRSGRLLGMFSTHYRAAHRPSESDLRMLDLLARQAADLIESKKAEESLKEADRRKDEFLATLAHELRNPLAPLRNGLQVMKLARLDGNAVEQARAMMERQLVQMVRLIDDLLDLSRVSRGKVELKKERVALASVVQQAVETSRPLIEASGHDFKLDVLSEPIFVDADVIRLVQVISNLLNNAAKYTDRGGRVTLAVERQGSDAVVSVRDTGVGIPAHMLPKVFEMFTQVDRSLDKSQGGLGIGLSLVKKLVQMHGGTVEAKSDGHGMGSAFVVRLPVVLALAGEQEQAVADVKPARTSRRRILVVDDNRDSANSLAMLLRIMGNDTQTAHDGLEALEVAAVYRPDVILLDIGMPKLDGYETARRIRNAAWGKNVVLVAQTGWGQEEDKRRSQEVGFNLHMVKPVDPAALEKLLAERLAITS